LERPWERQDDALSHDEVDEVRHEVEDLVAGAALLDHLVGLVEVLAVRRVGLKSLAMRSGYDAPTQLGHHEAREAFVDMATEFGELDAARVAVDAAGNFGLSVGDGLLKRVDLVDHVLAALPNEEVAVSRVGFDGGAKLVEVLGSLTQGFEPVQSVGVTTLPRQASVDARVDALDGLDATKRPVDVFEALSHGIKVARAARIDGGELGIDLSEKSLSVGNHPWDSDEEIHIPTKGDEGEAVVDNAIVGDGAVGPEAEPVHISDLRGRRRIGGRPLRAKRSSI
jgi:hypothetical protein